MKLNVGMLTGGLPFAGDSLERGSLGGSETAFLYAARELAKRGHKVRCWVNCERPGHYDGVDYLPIQKFNEFVPIQDFDVLISSRWPEYHTAPTRAAYRVLWLHDTLVDKARLMGTSWQTDDFWLLSDFHIENYCGKPGEEPSAENPHVPEIRPLVWKTSNGVDMDLIEANKLPKEKGKLIYTSRPERGLVFLIRDIFPRMLKERPDLKLYYANYSLEGMQVPDHVREAVAFCDAAAKQHPERIIKLGHLTKAQLYQQISSAELQVYPTAFPEISCCSEGTLIQMPCDRSKYPYGVPIETLVGKENFPVYAFDSEAKKFVLGNCSKVWKTGEDRECVDISLDDGSTLTVTPEHLVMDFNGNWHRADSLVPGMRLNALHMRYNTAIKDTNGRWVDEHRLVGAWKQGRQLRTEEHVNHLDPTRLNNDPEMLEVLHKSEHHSKTFRGLRHSAFSKQKREKSWSDYAKTDEAKARFAEHGKRRGEKFWEKFAKWSEEEKKQWLDARVCSRKQRVSIDVVDRAVELKESGFTYQQIAEQFEAEGITNTGGSLYSAATIASLIHRAPRVRELARQNHKVVSVKKSKKRYTVYDMTVDVHHNFVANGVVVHNCITAMEAQACGTPIVTTEDFALVETVGARESGVLIKGNPQDPKYQEEFAAKALRLLNKPEILAKFSEAGPKFIRKRGYTWPQVVESWEKRILEKLEERWQKNKVNVIKRLTHDGDLLPANVLLGSICAPEAQSLVDAEFAKADHAATTHQDIETLPTRYSVQLPSFNSAMELLASCAKSQPVKVLDYQTGDVSLGLFLQPRLPNVELTLYATDDEAATRLQHYVEKQGLQNVKVVTVLDDTQVYDLVLLNRFLDSTRFPEIVIGDLVRLSHENTEVLTITRFGPRGYTLRESEPTLDRFWNFNFDDLKALFPLPEQEIQGLFVPGSSPYVGHWVAHAKVKPLSKYTVDLKERIDRKRLFTRPYQSVGLGMIVKNEEDHLLRCLKAVRPYVDTIAIVDTGSTDKTLEIAEEFADKIIHHKFDNFGDARNVSKDAIDDDWFLWLDADEVLLGGEEISKHLISSLYNGYVTDQCVTGDTLVALPGEYVQIKDLVGRSSFLCWSYSEKLGKMVLSNVKAVVKTGHRKVVEVVMDSGVLRCTPDHPVMLRDGSYRPAGQLKTDDRLMPFYRSLGKINGKRVYADGRVGKLSWFVHLNNGETVPEHRYVYAQANGGIPNGYVVHHKNEDHLDNRVDNLQAMTWGAHSSLHHKGAKRPEATRSRTQRNAMKQHNSQKYSREEMLELIARHNGNMTAAMRELGITAPAFYHRLKRLSIDVNSIRAEFPSKSGKGRKRTREEFVSPLAPNNHRVVEVREGGWEDVYDMEVDETHNFVANGVVVHNCHLMIDVHGTKDSPIRLFKNKPEYRFTGYIHEHAEDTSKGPFGHSIGPAINLEGIKLAHYGYPSEAVRRKKCSSRNMELLIRDLKDHPNRPVNWLLFLRDCLNIVKWRLGENKPIHKNSVEHALLNTAVAIHLKFFNDPKHKLYAMVDPMYQEALKILALVGLPFETRKLPPIEVQLGLRAAVAGVDPNNEVKPQSRWFIDHDHFNAYMQSKLSELSVGLGDDKAKHEEALKAGRHTPTFYTDVEAAVDLLTLGVGKFR